MLFLLYHYFEAKEIYNAIRIFIAAYVWMTGFGNFSYYYKTNDYCVGRYGQLFMCETRSTWHPFELAMPLCLIPFT